MPSEVLKTVLALSDYAGAVGGKSYIWSHREGQAAAERRVYQPVFNVKDAGALGTGSGNDATAIDATIAAALAAGGGRVYFPAGIYPYSGSGILANPANGVAGPIVLMGDGPLASRLVFSSVSNPDCIKLSSQSAMGSGLNVGGGVRDLYVTGPSGANLINLNNLEFFLVDNVWAESGAAAVVVTECRLGTVRSSLLRQWNTDGIKVVGETHNENFFDLITITSSVGTGHGVNYTKTGTTLTPGFTMTNVKVFAAGGAAFNFVNTTAGNMFLFMDACTADGSFPSGGLKCVKVGNLNISNCHLLSNTSGSVAVELDACSNVVMTGGRLFAATGAAADLSLKNACSYITVTGTALTGTVQSIKVDGTTHTNVDLPLPPSQAATFCNDLTKIFSSGNKRRFNTPAAFLTDPAGGKAGSLGIGNNGASGLWKYFRINGSGGLEIYDDALAAALLTLTDAGALTVSGGNVTFNPTTLVSLLLSSGNFKLSQNTNDGTPMTVTVRKSRNNAACSANDIVEDRAGNFLNSTPTEVQGRIWRTTATGVTAGAEAVDETLFLLLNGALVNRWQMTSAGNEIRRSANAAQWIEGQVSELITLSTSGTTTDSAANLLPADAIIEAVVARVTTTIATATDWKLGDATTAGRFSGASSSLTAGSTVVGTVHADQTGTSIGPRQTAAAKLRITTTGTPSAGAIRVTVFYRQFVAPTS